MACHATNKTAIVLCYAQPSNIHRKIGLHRLNRAKGDLIQSIKRANEIGLFDVIDQVTTPLILREFFVIHPALTVKDHIPNMLAARLLQFLDPQVITESQRGA